MEIGKRIATLRRTHNVTQAQLAEYLNVLPQTISRWEADNGAPDIYLLPQIATFFEITLDELFGIGTLQKIDNLVCKYSVLRDEKTFQEAQRALDTELENAKLNKENTLFERLLALKMHLLLQKSRAFLNEADLIADELVELTKDENNELHLPILFQKTQFDVLNGKGYDKLKKAKEVYENEPSIIHTQLYQVALLEMHQDKELLSLYNTLQCSLEEQKQLMPFFFDAAANIGDIKFMETHKSIIDEAPLEEKFGTLYHLCKLYKEQHLEEKKNDLKAELKEILNELNENEFILKMYEDKLEEL